MRVFLLFATVATFTADPSYARAVSKSEASTVLDLLIQKNIPSVAGGLLSSRSMKFKIRRKPISTRHDSKSRRAELVYPPGETTSSQEEEPPEPPEASTNMFNIKTPLGGEEEYTTRMPEEPTTEETVQSQSEAENSGRNYYEGEAYAATLPPLRSGENEVPNGLALYSSSPLIPSTDPFNTNPITSSRLLDPFGYNMNPPLPGAIVTNPFEASPVDMASTLGTKVSFMNPGDSGVNAGKPTTTDQSSNTNGLSTEPEVSTGDPKKIKSIQAKADIVPDAATEKVKSDGSPVIVNVYISSTPDGKEEKTYEITKVVEGKSPDKEDPTAHGGIKEADAIAETEPNVPGSQKPIKNGKEEKPKNDSKEKKPINDGTEETGDDGQSDKDENSISQTTTQQPPKNPDKDSKNKNENKADPNDPNDTENSNQSNTASDKENTDATNAKKKDKLTEDPKTKDTKPDTEMKDTNPNDTTPNDTTPNDTKPNDTKPNDKKPNDTKPNDTNLKGTNSKNTKNEKTDKQETAKTDPPPDKMKHGDYTAFLSDGAKEDESFSTQSTKTNDRKFGKLTMSKEVADMIAWKGNPEEDTKDVHPARSKQRRRTRTFRA
ncbi:hypothetical protein MMC07_009062 [Pseudocyphellaria aurata]|nr:hypothetical protein [Pseudocyphellaria aurata]